MASRGSLLSRDRLPAASLLRSDVQPRRRAYTALSAVATLSLLVWCVLGLVDSIEQLSGPMGWDFLATQDIQGTVALPSANPSGMSDIQAIWNNPVPRAASAPRNVLGATAAFLTLWIIGALTQLAAGLRGSSDVGTIVRDFATGAALLALWGTLAIIGGFHLSVAPLYGLVLALAAVAFARRGGASSPVRPLSRDRTTLGLLFIAVAAVATNVLAATGDRLWWDGRVMWAFKAHVLFQEGTLPRWFFDPRIFPNPDYPLAVPLVDWWIFRHVGEAAAVLASFAGAVWYALLPLALWSGLRDRVDPQLAAAATLGVAGFWPIALYATGGTADVVFALAMLGAFVELEAGLRRSDVRSLWRASIFLTLGIFSKNEGLALALIAMLVGAFALFRSGERSILRYAPFGFPLLAFTPWLLYTRAMGATSGAMAADAQPGLIVDRMPVLLDGMKHLFSAAPWFPLPVMVLAGLIATFHSGLSPRVYLWLVLGGYFGAVCVVYLQAPVDLGWLLYTSLPRVLGAMVPATVFLSLLSTGTLPGGSTPTAAGL